MILIVSALYFAEGRKLTDVKSRLQKNSQLQREAQSDALHAAYNRQALDSDEKIKVKFTTSMFTL